MQIIEQHIKSETLVLDDVSFLVAVTVTVIESCFTYFTPAINSPLWLCRWNPVDENILLQNGIPNGDLYDLKVNIYIYMCVVTVYFIL